MKYKYQARTKTGELQVGNIDAPDKDSALGILATHQLFILNLEEAEKNSFFERFSNLFKKVKMVDVMIFTRQFSILLSAKVSLEDVLKNLYNQTSNQILKEAILEIGTDIDAGLSLSQALERQGHIFPDFYVNMVRSAEITGRVEEVMTFLADYLEKESALVSKIRGAMIYPAFVISLFVAIAIVMVVFVLPQIKPIFETAGIQLPLLTKILLYSGDFLISWWWVILMFLGVIFWILIDYFQSDEGVAVLDELKIRVPVFGKLAKQIYVARFAELTSVLIKGGIPITQALEIASRTINNVVYRDALHEVADGVRRGELMSAMLAKHDYFPPLVYQMVAVGEATGKLDIMLSKVSSFFTREVDGIVGNLVELIQPILMLMMGLFVGGLFAAILLPLYQLTNAF